MKEKLPIRIIHYASIHLSPTATGNAESTVISTVMLIILGGFAYWFHTLGGGILFWLFMGVFIFIAYTVVFDWFFLLKKLFSKDEVNEDE